MRNKEVHDTTRDEFAANSEAIDIWPSPNLPGRLERHQSMPLKRLASHGTEAVAAVNGFVAPGQEWHLSVYATLGANRWMHLPRSTAVPAAAAALVPAGASAGRAATGLIGEPLRSKELLLACCEDKNSAAVSTSQVFV